VIVTVFRSRLRADLAAQDLDAYAADIEAVERHAALAPGFCSTKTYLADDGERLTLVRFETAEAQRLWARDPTHLAAQARARDHFYSWYQIGVYADGRERCWTCEPATEGRGDGRESAEPTGGRFPDDERPE